MNKKEAIKDLLGLIEKLELVDSAKRALGMVNRDILDIAYSGCLLAMYLENEADENLTEVQSLSLTIYLKMAELSLK